MSRAGAIDLQLDGVALLQAGGFRTVYAHLNAEFAARLQEERCLWNLIAALDFLNDTGENHLLAFVPRAVGGVGLLPVSGVGRHQVFGGHYGQGYFFDFAKSAIFHQDLPTPISTARNYEFLYTNGISYLIDVLASFSRRF